MTDIFSPEKRSRIMATVKGKDTKPEMRVRKELHRRGLRYRLHAKNLPGKPDLVFPRYKLALFVHGCFWHGHENCKKSTIPTSNVEFWENKIRKNKERDAVSIERLKRESWRCVVLWECQIDKGIVDWDLLAYQIRNSNPI
jgi:DNA mismatch endonuclease (patch repair protein)